MKRIIFLLIFSFIGLTFIAQQNKIDSLLTVLKTAKEDTNKVHTLNKLSYKLWQTGGYEQALQYSNNALALAQKIDFKKGKCRAFNNLGLVYADQGNYDDALKNYFATLKICKEIGSTKGIAMCYNNIGLVYCSQGNYPEALKNQLTALKMREEVKDEEGLAMSYGNIGIIYYSLGNYPDALKNQFIGLKIKEKMGDKRGISNSYNILGAIYYQQANYAEALKNYFASLKICKEMGDKLGIANASNNIGLVYSDQGNYAEALKKYFFAIKIEEEIGDKQGMANSYNNLAIIYTQQGNYTEAFKNYAASLKIFEEIGDKHGIAMSYNNLGSTHIKLKKLDVAKKQLKKALTLSKEIASKKEIKLSYNSLSTIDSMQGNWKGAYDYHKLFILYRDSIDNEETKEKTIQASMNYEFDKKEALTKAEQDKRDALAATEMKKQQVIRYAVSGILVLVILFTMFLYNRFRLIHKQKNIIEVKEKETQHQKDLVDEKQKEIIESITYAKRLQEAILPPQEFIDKHIKENFILYKPKDLVAGDFYWAESVNDLFFIAAADSTGHGVPGAMVSVVCSNALNRTIKEFKETEPGKILDKTRELVIETFEKSTSEVKDGMDISLLCFEFPSPLERDGRVRLTWSGAHNSLWYVTSRASATSGSESVTELVEVKADKQPIGKTEYPKPFITHQIEYKEGTTFYLFTDGYADQFGGPNGKKFMAKNFKQVLVANSHLPLPKQKEVLEQTFQNWVGDLEQVDDVCVIGIRI